jgi:nicotinamide-nucleotide amidase
MTAAAAAESSRDGHERDAARSAEKLSDLCTENGLHVAVAESLTGGRIASQLAAASGSGDWFVGGIVAYSSEVKHTLLEVPRGSVISRTSAEAMARSVARLLGADVALAATGAGGPHGQDGEEPGTTWIAVLVADEVTAELHHFSGEPIEVLTQTQQQALRALLRTVSVRFGTAAS